jgi:hypothetical protein
MLTVWEQWRGGMGYPWGTASTGLVEQIPPCVGTYHRFCNPHFSCGRDLCAAKTQNQGSGVFEFPPASAGGSNWGEVPYLLPFSSHLALLSMANGRSMHYHGRPAWIHLDNGAAARLFAVGNVVLQSRFSFIQTLRTRFPLRVVH